MPVCPHAYPVGIPSKGSLPSVPTQDDSQFELRDYFWVLRRRRSVIVVATLVVVAAALAASFLQTPVYEATAEVLLQPRSTESLFDPTTGERRDPTRTVQTEIQVLKSQPVVDAVKQQLGAAPRVSVAPVGQTDVIHVKALNTDPHQAAAVANAYADAYIDFRRKQAVADLLAAGKEIQRKVADLQKQIDALPGPNPDRPAPADRTAEQRDALVQQQALFRQKLDQLQVDAALKTGGAQLVTPASPATSPVKPTPVRTAAVALVVGLMFGVATAFLFEYLDDSIKTKEDLERAAHDLATLGLIPVVAGWKNSKRPVVVSVSDPKSPAAEAYRSLRTSIQFLGLDRPLTTLQVTSPSAAEGKTTTIANLAVVLAEAGERVVVVDCDLRRPRLSQYFNISSDVGFTSVLLGDVPLSSAVHDLDGTGRLKVVVTGPIPPNPAELLAGRRAVEALAALRAEADVVLIDSPPVLPVTDAAVLSNRVDGVLMVATAGKSTRREFHRAQEVLSQVGAPLIGTVLNGVAGDSGYGYSYGYQYAYGPSQTNGRRGRAAKDEGLRSASSR